MRPAPGAPLFPPGVGPRDVMVVRDGGRGYARRELDRETGGVARRARAAAAATIAEEGPPGCASGSRDPDAALAIVAPLEDPPAGSRPSGSTRGRACVVHAQIRARCGSDRAASATGSAIAGQLKVEARPRRARGAARCRAPAAALRAASTRIAGSSCRTRCASALRALADQTFEGQASRHRAVGRRACRRSRALVDAGAEVDVDADVEAARRAALDRGAKLKPKPPAALQRDAARLPGRGPRVARAPRRVGRGRLPRRRHGPRQDRAGDRAAARSRASSARRSCVAPTSVVLNWVASCAGSRRACARCVYGERADRAAALAAARQEGRADRQLRPARARRRAAREGRVRDARRSTRRRRSRTPRTQRAKAARTLDAEFRIALTGTPSRTTSASCGALFAIVFPGLLGSWDQFRERFAVPIEREHSDPARARRSRALIRPFMLRRTKAEVAPELPARTEIARADRAVDAGARALRGRAARGARASSTQSKRACATSSAASQVLAALTRLRLLASHPRSTIRASPVGVVEAAAACSSCVDELRAEGHRALVFSQFTSHLALVREALDRARRRATLYLDGATPAARARDAGRRASRPARATCS